MPRKSSGRARKADQRARRNYSIQREDRQLTGEQPTTPEGAVRDERVPAGPDPPCPELVRQAIRNGWNTSEAGKVKAVDDLIAAVRDPDTPAALRVRCVQALLMADAAERERDTT